MAQNESPVESAAHGAFPKTLRTLEQIDNVAHVFVAVFFIVMAVTVLIYSAAIFERQIPLIGAAFHKQPEQTARAVPAGVESDPHRNAPEGTKPTGESSKPVEGEESAGSASKEPFFHNSLELLSSILFVVIILELLKTIITYLQTRDIHAIMKEFLVVGIISSVRKILLVGAESSLSGESGWGFIKEAGGTVISIIGILLLIAGLVWLQRSHTDSTQIRGEEPEPA